MLNSAYVFMSIWNISPFWLKALVLGLVPDWLIPLRRDLPLLRAVMSEMALTDRFYALLNELEGAGYEKRDIKELDAIFTGMEMDKQGVMQWGGLKKSKPCIDDATFKFEEALTTLDSMVGFEQSIHKLRQEWTYHMEKESEGRG